MAVCQPILLARIGLGEVRAQPAWTRRRPWLSDGPGRTAIALSGLLAMVVSSGALGDVIDAARTRGDARRAQEQEGVGRPGPTLPQQPYRADYDLICRQPAGNEEADLCQQWRAANGSLRGALAAERQNVLSEEQILLTKLETAALCATLLLTALATYTAGRAARAAEKAVDVSSNAAQRQLRAYVLPSGVQISRFEAGMTVLARVKIKNFGQTPAYKLRVRLSYLITSDLNTKSFPISPSNMRTNATYQGPGEHTIMQITDLDALTVGDVNAIKAGIRAIFIYGHIDYFDCFGLSHEGSFRFIYGGEYGASPEGQVIQHQEGNEHT